MTVKSLLLVDDEAGLVELLKKYLERNGMRVQACTDPALALQLVEADPQQFWLVVSDLTLTGLSGEELIERIRVVRPGLPAIIASGYPYQPRMSGIEFLQKPFLPKMLVDLIQRISQRDDTGATDPASAGAASG
jgi:DNA-binding NtrC family response regulator